MKILLVTRGSQGDIYPYLTIASTLVRRGHEVTLNLPQLFEEEAKAYRLNYTLQAFDDIEGMISRAGDQSQSIGSFLRWTRGVIDSQFEQLVPLLQQHDLMVATNSEFAAPSVAEYCRKPLIRTAYAPFIPGRKIPPPVMPFPKPHPLVTPSILWKMLCIGNNFMTRKTINKNRSALGMPPIRNCGLHAAEQAYNYLLFSRYLGSTDPDWAYRWEIGGYCFNDTLQYEASAYRELTDFIRKDKRAVVFFTLGSCSSKESNRFCERLIAVCRKHEYRLIIGSGWSKTGAYLQNDDSIFLLTKAIPHSLIFPHCAGAIHHGGCGTTHSVARAGIPQLIVPLIIDQPYWAYRVRQLGVGPEAVKIGKVSDRELEAKVCDLVGNALYRQKADELGKQIRSEDAVTHFCDYLESVARQEGKG